MDPELGTVEALAVSGDRIVAVGSVDEVARHIDAGTIMVDLAGTAVIPGIVDPHTHILTDTGGVDVGQPQALSNGITTLAEGFIDPARLETMLAHSSADELIVRANLYLIRTDNCGGDQGRWYEEHPPGEILGDRLQVAGVKIFTDGGTCGPIASSEPWAEGFETAQPFHSLETLTGLIRDADDAGYQVLVHAIGDRAVTQTMDAYAQVLGDSGNPLRHRIDHNSIVTPEMAGRYEELGLLPVLFGWVATCDILELKPTPLWRENGEEPIEILEANPNTPVAWHGDDPWVGPVSPLMELYSMVTRSEKRDDGSVCEPPPWLAEDVVTPTQALAMMTTNSAYVLGLEAEIGSLTPGKLADMVILTDNVLGVPPDDIPSIEVVATMVGGIVEYCRPGSGDLCPGWASQTDLAFTSSAARPGQPVDLAFDGVSEGESFWSSGEDPPGWVQVEFGAPTDVAGLRLTVFQNPPSDTVHVVEAQVDGSWGEVARFESFTETGDVLEWTADPGLEGVASLRITTLETLSWPEWYEIEVLVEE